MATVSPRPPKTGWTLADLVDRFGEEMPLCRVVLDPAPGTATVDDVIRLEADGDRLCELINGVLVEKSLRFSDAVIGGLLTTEISLHAKRSEEGIVLGASGPIELDDQNAWMPDFCFVSWQRLGSGAIFDQPTLKSIPDLAGEIINAGNSAREMQRKLADYFEAGVRLVWYVDPPTKTVTVYTSPERSTVLKESDTLTGGDVLPGLEIDLRALFRTPEPPGDG